MIRKISSPPSFDRIVNHSNNETPKVTLKNNVTGSMIKVKNSNCDFKVVQKAISFHSNVKNKEAFKPLRNFELRNPLNERFRALGMAVSALSTRTTEGEDVKAKEKAAEICEKFQGTDSQPSRGMEFISQFIGKETSNDSELYELALRVGLGIKDSNTVDSSTINDFNSKWNVRLKEESKK